MRERFKELEAPCEVSGHFIWWIFASHAQNFTCSQTGIILLIGFLLIKMENVTIICVFHPRSKQTFEKLLNHRGSVSSLACEKLHFQTSCCHFLISVVWGFGSESYVRSCSRH